jgi:hypothetical protein
VAGAHRFAYHGSLSGRHTQTAKFLRHMPVGFCSHQFVAVADAPEVHAIHFEEFAAGTAEKTNHAGRIVSAGRGLGQSQKQLLERVLQAGRGVRCGRFPGSHDLGGHCLLNRHKS